MTISLNPAWASELVELLDQQRCLYAQLQQLSRQQGRLVGDAGADMSGLVLVLGQRQNLIDQLARLNAHVEPYRRNWPALWESLDAASRVRVRGLIEEIQALLDQIVGRDEKDRAALLSHTHGHQAPRAAHASRSRMTDRSN